MILVGTETQIFTE